MHNTIRAILVEGSQESPRSYVPHAQTTSWKGAPHRSGTSAPIRKLQAAARSPRALRPAFADFAASARLGREAGPPHGRDARGFAGTEKLEAPRSIRARDLLSLA